MEENKYVICPNCHTATELKKEKANSWRTLDPLESIIAGVAPVLLAAFVAAACFALCHNKTALLDFGVVEIVFFVVIFVSMPIFMRLLERYEKNQRTLDGYEVYCVQCPCCKNIYRIVRPMHPASDSKLLLDAHETSSN